MDLPPDIRRGDAVNINVTLEPLEKNEYEGINANELYPSTEYKVMTGETTSKTMIQNAIYAFRRGI